MRRALAAVLLLAAVPARAETVEGLLARLDAVSPEWRSAADGASVEIGAVENGDMARFDPVDGSIRLAETGDPCVDAADLAHELTHLARLGKGSWMAFPPPWLDRTDYAMAALLEEAEAHVSQIAVAEATGCVDRLPGAVGASVAAVSSAEGHEAKVEAWLRSSPSAPWYASRYLIMHDRFRLSGSTAAGP